MRPPWRPLRHRRTLGAQIVFLCLVAAPEGVRRLCSTFPAVRVVASEIDEGLDELYHIVPGVGEVRLQPYAGEGLPPCAGRCHCRACVIMLWRERGACHPSACAG